MSYLRVLCLLQILQYSSGGNHSALQVVYTKSLQCLYTKVLMQFLTCRLVGKHPVVHLESKEAVAKETVKLLLLSAVIQHLFRLEVRQQLLNIIVSALSCKILAS